MNKPNTNPCIEDCPDCAGSGFQTGGKVECLRCGGEGKLYLHDWIWPTLTAPDGTEFKRCRKCKIEVEV